MFFTVLAARSQPPTEVHGKAFLIKDNWDDWGKFQTMFSLFVCDYAGTQHDVGSVKIGQFGLLPGGRILQGNRAPTLPVEFDALDEQCFSLGQSEAYYEALNQLTDDLRLGVLRGLRDCAFDLAILDRAVGEEVMSESLLRSVSIENVRNRFHRLASGDTQLTEFQFEYQFSPADANVRSPVISFHVKPKSEPPTNVHVLIGRNGVGKTRCIQFMAKSICGDVGNAGQFGNFHRLGDNKDGWSFAGLIVVSFSAFDSFVLPESNMAGLRLTMVGLRKRSDQSDTEAFAVKTPQELTNDFRASFKICRNGLRRDRWQVAVKTLGNDPLFAEAGVADLLELPDGEWEAPAQSLFQRLSSGHAIVLLTITRLVELVDERTFLLLDEPEGHLHPPLLSAFIRAISDLLIHRNGVAVIATHSPVVLQEVPRSCVWMLQRSGTSSVAERPSIETFGENVGILTRSVFGLEVTSSGFHQLLRQSVENRDRTYEMVLDHFDHQLGAEARALLRSLVAGRDATRGEDL